ncbi:MAG TPA: NAD(P)-dependent oxidoreductase [Planctomycetota bacterium]|jgi:2-hydroxy-3-oxopropionate reductase|nr:NAD(P)-dependent oxidoreductase [Planctomycetota bacterium]
MSFKVGFIGMGIMGRPMARNLLKAGHAVTVYNRTASRAKELENDGARVASTPKECARGNDIVITIVTDSPDVEAVLLGPDGAVEGASRGTVFIDMSTISPEVTRSIHARLAERGMKFLDAPVSGGDIGAQKGTLTIMVGGDPEVFEQVKGVFEPMGKRITHMGPPGAGQVTKASNQILCALNMLGVCEALALAQRSGLDLRKMHQVVTGGAANSWALENLGKRIIDGDFAPGFMVRLIQKDLGIVLDAARSLNLPLAGSALCNQYFRANEAHGEGDLGTQAMYKVLQRLAALGN